MNEQVLDQEMAKAEELPKYRKKAAIFLIIMLIISSIYAFLVGHIY